MDRPYVICHMTVSLDGKVTGEFLSHRAGTAASELYYQIHRESGADGFACGRVTMEGSFTNGWYPDLSGYPAVRPDPVWMDFLPDDPGGFWAVAFDPHGRLGWRSNRICDPDGDPGYDGARILEVVTEQADPRYLGYLEAMQIPYIFAGAEELDVREALFKLRRCFGIRTLLLEGGSILNGAFQRAGVVDELSLTVAPIVASSGDKPLFTDGSLDPYRLEKAETHDGILWLRYSR